MKKNFNLAEDKRPVSIGGKIYYLPVKYRRKDGKLIKQIVSPLTSKGVLPTFMHTGYNSASIKNAISVGYFPKPFVVEIWESENPSKFPKESDLTFDNIDEARLSPYIHSYLKKGKLKLEVLLPSRENSIKFLQTREPSNMEEWKNNDKIPGFLKRKVYNKAKPIINKAVREGNPKQYIRIRKLSVKEYLRFMGVSDEDIKKMISSENSKADLYAQAGNSIVVNVLFHLFRKMFIDRDSYEEMNKIG